MSHRNNQVKRMLADSSSLTPVGGGGLSHTGMTGPQKPRAPRKRQLTDKTITEPPPSPLSYFMRGHTSELLARLFGRERVYIAACFVGMASVRVRFLP